MTEVAQLPVENQQRGHRSILMTMSERYGMEPQAFEATVRATCSPKGKSARPLTKEEFAAFLLVAHEYGLNPLLKEIYAFQTQGGGIQPIVPIDGWTNIINSNPQLDGVEFDDHQDNNGDLTAITARIWRKDRSKPIVVTEYMAECRRNTDTWKQWPARMLRHKALIQCARYAFGLAGIADPDEADRISDSSGMRDVTPKAPSPPPAPKPEARDGGAPAAQEAAEGETVDHGSETPDATEPETGGDVSTGEAQSSTETVDPETGEITEHSEVDPDAYLEDLDARLTAIDDGDGESFAELRDEVEATMDQYLPFPPDQDKARELLARHEKRFET